jgi:ABC-2 type transport system permease protein
MNGTIIRMTARGLLSQRRAWLLLPMPLVLVGLTVIGRASGVGARDWIPVVAGFGFSIILPLTALIVGTAVLGAEIDDGTITHILTKPLPRYEIILSKLLVATVVTMLSVGLPMAVAVPDSVRLGVGLAVGALIASLAYSALFIALSLVVRRAVPVGLLYVLVWEGTLGNALEGTQMFSVQQCAKTVAAAIADYSDLAAKVSTPLAATMIGVLAVAGTALAIDRLRSFSLAGETS